MVPRGWRPCSNRGPRTDSPRRPVARCGGPFIEVDCGALSPNLIESELFGYVKGAFTGAQEDRTGLLQAADGGTLFLDEINNLPLESQTKLLRVLQQRKIRRVGETRERTLDIRLISASSKALKDLIAEGAFRQDLYYPSIPFPLSCRRYATESKIFLSSPLIFWRNTPGSTTDRHRSRARKR